MDKQAAKKEIISIKERLTELTKIIEAPDYNWKDINEFDDIFKYSQISKKDFYEKHKSLAPHRLVQEEIELAIEIVNQDPLFPDYNNSSQYKYEPRFDMRSSSGFGFSDTYFDAWGTVTGVGSRLCYKDYNAMIHMVAILISKYETMLKK